MKPGFKERIVFVLFFVFLIGSLKLTAGADTFFGNLQTGLVELKDYKYPVYLFVPENYKDDRTYPLIFTVPGEGESPEKNIQFWMGLAKRNSMIVVAPTNLWPEELPTRMDEWLLKIKKDITARYQIAPNKVYLIGKGGGAHYASYLGVKYPTEFSAVALLGGSWNGKFEKLIRPESKPRKQVPFFLAIKEEDTDVLEKAQQKAYQFEKKGYPVYLLKLPKDQDYSSDEFKKQLLAWFEEKGEDWQKVVAASKKSLKEKISIAIEDFFRL